MNGDLERMERILFTVLLKKFVPFWTATGNNCIIWWRHWRRVRIYTLRHYEGLTLEAIGLTFDISRETVRQILWKTQHALESPHIRESIENILAEWRPYNEVY